MAQHLSEKRAAIRPQTARILAAVFLFLGILLGTFVGPQLVNKAVRKISERIAVPSDFFPFRLGLDIQGGTHLVYRAALKNIPQSDYSSSMESVRDVIERRINLFGVAEPVVQVEKAGGEQRLIVELAGIKDINSAIRMIGETPFLEFKEERADAEREKILKDQKENGPLQSEDPFFAPTLLTGRFIKKAAVDFDDTTFQPLINLELSDEGAQIFAEMTKRNVDKQIAIYLDGAPISAPVVREEITGGRAVISGSFTPVSAKELAGRLNAGALPVPISLIAQQSVGAALGEVSLQKSVFAGIMGFLAVAAFMILWYRLPGLLAVFALLLYVAIVLSIFKLIPVTLTVAGITGFILSIGMAVDANILIFERMKEELRQGKGLERAVEEGFSRAWTSIRDSNISSLITSGVLYWLGNGIVRGFALTLAIGIIISMFSAISVTRTLLIAFMTSKIQRLKFLFLSGLYK